jgi:hypothetical protein
MIEAFVAGVAAAGLVAWAIAPAPLPARLTPPAQRPRPRPRPRRPRHQRPRHQRPQRQHIDRAALVSALRRLGHKAAEAKIMAAAVPPEIVDIGDAITFLYRRR